MRTHRRRALLWHKPVSSRKDTGANLGLLLPWPGLQSPLTLQAVGRQKSVPDGGEGRRYNLRGAVTPQY